ncbi:MAG: hypothetical protein KDB22_15750 [Planctomycetales bacterium]|nr:hypothetical protein [Planctomycetales bacterium]
MRFSTLPFCSASTALGNLALALILAAATLADENPGLPANPGSSTQSPVVMRLVSPVGKSEIRSGESEAEATSTKSPADRADEIAAPDLSFTSIPVTVAEGARNGIPAEQVSSVQTLKEAKEPQKIEPIQRHELSNATECPGSPTDGIELQASYPDDIPLEQEEHPYDAPDALQTSGTELSLATSNHSYTARELAIHRRINACLEYFLNNPENVNRRGPWAMMHATLPFGVEAQIIAGNRRVNAIGWMCFNGVCAKQRMFQPTRTGFRTNSGPGVQGHEGQFLAILAQSRVSSDYPLQIGNRRYTVADLVKYEMSTCREKSELTFKLIGLSHYLNPNQRWRDNTGKLWNLEKMVGEELQQPVVGAACGGTHRLMGLSYAVIKRRKDGYPLDGHWERARSYLNDYIGYALSLQNPDGSFSTEWLESRGAAADIDRKVQTTGHILEWLVFSLPEEHLRSDAIEDSVEFLLATVGAEPSRDWAIGPRGHALRALALYNQRMFDVQPGQIRTNIAKSRINPANRY